MSDRRFHTDSRADENFTKDGLETLTGQPSRKWGRYVVKELVDNALGAVEEADTETPTITVNAEVEDAGQGEYFTSISVSDNGGGISESQIEQIADVARFGGTKRHYALPTRGTQGNALMTVLGIQSLAGGSLTIETRGQCYEFSVNAGGITGEPTVDVSTPDSVHTAADGGVTTDGTTVTVEFGDKGAEWARFNPTAHTLLGFTALNPHVQFNIPIRGTTDAAKNTTTRYEPRGSATTGRVHWMSPQAFEERIKADIRAAPDLTVGEFITEFEGLVSRKKRRAVMDTALSVRLSIDADAPVSDACTRGDQLHPNVVETLHASMCMHTDKRAASGLDNTLGSVGNSLRAGPRKCIEYLDIADIEHLVEDLQADGNDVDSWEDLSIYYQTSGVDERDAYRIPFVYEIGVLPLPPDNSDTVEEKFGINQSVSYSSPKMSLQFSGAGNTEHTARSIEGAFENQDHGFVIVSNLTCPNIPFKDKGKQDFPTEPFEQEISETVGKAVRKYQRDLRPMLNALEEAQKPQPPTLDESKKADKGFVKEVTYDLFDKVYQEATEGGEYTITQRQLYYNMRPHFQRRADIEGYKYKCDASYDEPEELEFNYSTFQGYVKDYEEEVLGERVVHRDERGFFIEPHSNQRVELSTKKVNQYDPTDSVTTEYNTLLFVEKTGFYKLLHKDFEITKRYDIGLINARGYSTNAIRDLTEMVQVENEDVTLLTLTDFDINGIGIASNASEADELSTAMQEFDTKRIGVTLADVKEYELTIESVSPDEDTLTELKNRYERGEVDKDVYEFLRAGKRVEINAFSPTEFKTYIEDKLQQLGVEKIEPDKDEVETPDVDNWEDVKREAVAKGVTEYIDDCFDDDLIESVTEQHEDIEPPEEDDRETADADADEIHEKWSMLSKTVRRSHGKK